MRQQPLRSRLGTGLAVGATAALLARDLDLPTLVSYWGDRAALTTAAALLFAALWTWAAKLRPLLVAAAFGLGTVWLAVAYTPLTSVLARDLPRRDALGQADAVFVLASALQQDGELTTPAMSRLLHGLELLGQGLAPRLVLSELPPDTPDAYKPYAPPTRALMANLGLRAELLTVGPVRNTRDEAVAVAELFRARGWSRVLLVTSPIHSRRAAQAFEAVGLTVVSSPSVETQYDLEMLDRPDGRLSAFGDLIHELVGLYVYRSRGWIR